jgi:hypothetical protein
VEEKMKKIKKKSRREEEKSKGKKGSTLTIFFYQTILISFSQSNHRQYSSDSGGCRLEKLPVILILQEKTKQKKKGRGVDQEKETAWKVPSNCACFSSRLGMGDL